MTDLLITIPVYNEAERIETSTKQIIDFFELKEIDYKIILSVDVSPDNSENVCSQLERNYSGVHTIVNQKKEGRGLAVRNAWLKYDAKVYSFIDADLSVGVSSLYEGYRLITEDNAKFVIGSRYSAGSNTLRPPLRKAVSFSYNILLQKLFQNDIKDYQCGLKIISSDIMNTVVSLSRVNSWFWDAEIIIIALSLGFRVHQLPVNWIERKYSRTSLTRLFHDMILHGWGILLLFKRMKKDIRFSKNSEVHSEILKDNNVKRS